MPGPNYSIDTTFGSQLLRPTLSDGTNIGPRFYAPNTVATFRSVTITGSSGSTTFSSATFTGVTTFQGALLLSSGTAPSSVSTGLTGGSVSVTGTDQVGYVTLSCTSQSAVGGLNFFSLVYAAAKTSTVRPHVVLTLDSTSPVADSLACQFQVRADGSAGNWTGFTVFGYFNTSTFTGANFHYLVVL